MIVLILAAVFIAIIILILKNNNDGYDDYDDIFSPQKAAGRRGEAIASGMIKSILDNGDVIITGLHLIHDGQKTEFDNIIINKNGLFIIEVKNYSGRLEGSEGAREWTKYHVSDGGNTYEKIIKNPIKQVKRQIYILKSYLSALGITTWINGYVFLLNGNDCSASSEYLLYDIDDIERKIHTTGKNKLTPDTIDSIKQALDL